MNNPNGAVIYRGPSLLDRKPIVVVAVGLGRVGSSNSKTGAMVQTYILRDDIHPVAAVKSGADSSICGQCPLRPSLAPTGAPRCYVNKSHGPAAVYRALAGYPTMSPADVSALALSLGRPIRLGTYGDPGAVPADVWQALTSIQTRFTGYSHQWRRSPNLRMLAMASVGSATEAQTAQSAGWRTFRVRRADEPALPDEVVCPASKEAGRRVQCSTCLLCSGASRTGAKSVVIIDHGPTARS